MGAPVNVIFVLVLLGALSDLGKASGARTSLGATQLSRSDAKPAAVRPPRTVDEAVAAIRSRFLKPADEDWILRNPQDEVVMQLYRPFGTALRNQFHLWKGNDALVKSCGTPDPEGCSVVILEHLWDTIHAAAPPELQEALICQFALSKIITIGFADLHGMRVDGFLRTLSSRVEAAASFREFPKEQSCYRRVRVVAKGEYDPKCYVSTGVYEAPEHLNLQDALSRIGFNIQFTVKHSPPDIQLVFDHPCHFKTDPGPPVRRHVPGQGGDTAQPGAAAGGAAPRR